MSGLNAFPIIAPALITPSPSSASSITSAAAYGSDVEADPSKPISGYGLPPANIPMEPPQPIAPISAGHVPVTATSIGSSGPLVLPSQSIGVSNIPHHPITEFLYQLTKMLTDNNREIIEWVPGRIRVHDPKRLADEVLHKYFRHNKFASFQRQLNYFGFRKIAGKGRMSPCSYVNDAATDDLSSLLFIKRKTNGKKGKDDESKNSKKRKLGQEQEQTSLSIEDYNAAKRRTIEDLNNCIKGRIPTIGSYIAPITSLSSQAAPASCTSFEPNTKQESQHERINPHAVAAVANQRGTSHYQPTIDPVVDNQDAASAAFQLSLNPTAASQSSSMPCPATAAMNAAFGQSNSMFDSAAHNLNLLVGDNSAPAPNAGSNHLLNRIPSCKSLFPSNLSSSSLSHMAAANLGNAAAGATTMANCFPSLLDVGSILSRDPSLVDLAMLPTLAPNTATLSYPSSTNGGMFGGVVTGFEPTPIQEMKTPASRF